jgi:hypothetical protein
MTCLKDILAKFCLSATYLSTDRTISHNLGLLLLFTAGSYICTVLEYPLIKGIMALKDVDSRVFTRMLHGKNLTR